ncbi:hypothetical protein [Pleionea sediminis]|uniref:hypothetical protein n=1 Tax=Pleionea sediminis TaxID=2569479 RepID=UPI001184CE5A|nr:hypothetical protein [Pleionea sediminis]
MISSLFIISPILSQAIEFSPKEVDEGDKVKFTWPAISNLATDATCYVFGVPGISQVQGMGSTEFTAYNSLSAEMICFDRRTGESLYVDQNELTVNQTNSRLKFVPSKAEPGQDVKLLWNISKNRCDLYGIPNLNQISGKGSYTITADENLNALAYCWNGQEPIDFGASLKTDERPEIKAGFNLEQVNNGESVTFSWTTPNASSCVVTGDINTTGVAGAQTLVVNSPKTVNVTCVNGNGRSSQDYSVNLNESPKPIISASINPKLLRSPGVVRINGQAEHAERCSLKNLNSPSGETKILPPTFGVKYYLKDTGIFKLSCNGQGGESTQYFHVFVGSR